jgi:hypothetical protein
MRYLRRELLELRREDDLRWVLRWLAKEKHCEPAIFQQLTQSPVLKARLAALDAKEEYLIPSRSMVALIERGRGPVSRATSRGRRTAIGPSSQGGADSAAHPAQEGRREALPASKTPSGG